MHIYICFLCFDELPFYCTARNELIMCHYRCFTSKIMNKVILQSHCHFILQKYSIHIKGKYFDEN